MRPAEEQWCYHSSSSWCWPTPGCLEKRAAGLCYLTRRIFLSQAGGRVKQLASSACRACRGCFHPCRTLAGAGSGYPWGLSNAAIYPARPVSAEHLIPLLGTCWVQSLTKTPNIIVNRANPSIPAASSLIWRAGTTRTSFLSRDLSHGGATSD